MKKHWSIWETAPNWLDCKWKFLWSLRKKCSSSFDTSGSIQAKVTISIIKFISYTVVKHIVQLLQTFYEKLWRWKVDFYRNLFVKWKSSADNCQHIMILFFLNVLVFSDSYTWMIWWMMVWWTCNRCSRKLDKYSQSP